MITTPGGKIASNQMVRNVPLSLGDKIILTDLVLLGLEGINIILGTNWMTQHNVVLNIAERVVEINSSTHGIITLHLPAPDCLSTCAFTIIGA